MPRKKTPQSPPPQPTEQTPAPTPQAAPATPKPTRRPNADVDAIAQQIADALKELAPGFAFTQDTHDAKGRAYPVELDLAGSLPSVWALCAFSLNVPQAECARAKFLTARVTVRCMVDGTARPGFDWALRATYENKPFIEPGKLTLLGAQGLTTNAGLERTLAQFSSPAHNRNGDECARAADLLTSITKRCQR